jgi:hypothetical protein
MKTSDILDSLRRAGLSKPALAAPAGTRARSRPAAPTCSSGPRREVVAAAEGLRRSAAHGCCKVKSGKGSSLRHPPPTSPRAGRSLVRDRCGAARGTGDGGTEGGGQRSEDRGQRTETSSGRRPSSSRKMVRPESGAFGERTLLKRALRGQRATGKCPVRLAFGSFWFD